MGRLLDLPHISWRTCVADQLSDRKLVAWPMWLLLGGRLAGAVPGSLLVPFADRGWPPDRLSADTAVSLGHLLACNVGTDCGWGDADHRADRKNWLTETLGLPATDPARYAWQLVEPGDQDHMPAGQRLLHVVADRMHWLQALDQARRRAEGQSEDLSATGEGA